MRFIICPHCDHIMTEAESHCPPWIARRRYQRYDETCGDLDCEEWEMKCDECGKRFGVHAERRPDYETFRLLGEW